MVTLKRLAIVALAYAGAVLAVALGFVGYALILSEGRDLLDPREIGFGLAVFGLFAATYALPVAVPVIDAALDAAAAAFFLHLMLEFPRPWQLRIR